MKKLILTIGFFVGFSAQAFTTSWNEAIIELGGVNDGNKWRGQTESGQECKVEFFMNFPHGRNTVYIFMRGVHDWQLVRFAEFSMRTAFDEYTTGDDHVFTELDSSNHVTPVVLQIQYIGQRKARIDLRNAPRDNTLRDRGHAHCIVPAS